VAKKTKQQISLTRRRFDKSQRSAENYIIPRPVQNVTGEWYDRVFVNWCITAVNFTSREPFLDFDALTIDELWTMSL
jgi:hypothetical protein